MTLNSRTRAAIAATAFFAALAAGDLIDSGTHGPTAPAPAASSCTVFAGRSGSLPCTNKYANTPDSRLARQIAGRTVTGCALGMIQGGLAGLPIGCLSGVVANIPW